jgi:hypothetical protein
MSVAPSIAAQVILRARSRCEYCGMSQSLQGATFHIEHITPITCGGSSDLGNLALACPSCNLHKSDRSHVFDSLSDGQLLLFHPRNDVWEMHFEWQDTELIGLTAIGRATIHALDLNHPRRHRVREAEKFFGLFPPS